jgi:hypothetical protein
MAVRFKGKKRRKKGVTRKELEKTQGSQNTFDSLAIYSAISDWPKCRNLKYEILCRNWLVVSFQALPPYITGESQNRKPRENPMRTCLRTTVYRSC